MKDLKVKTSKDSNKFSPITVTVTFTIDKKEELAEFYELKNIEERGDLDSQLYNDDTGNYLMAPYNIIKAIMEKLT